MGISRCHPDVYASSEVSSVSWNDLINLVNYYKEQHYDIFIGLDANSNCQNRNSDITHFKKSTDLYDCYDSFFPQSQVASKEGGSSRIYTFLVSLSLLPEIKKIYFLPFDDIIQSYHRALILELKTNDLYNTSRHDYTSIYNRKLVMSKPQII